jgi:hypothetical protein
MNAARATTISLEIYMESLFDCFAFLTIGLYLLKFAATMRE